MIVLVVLLLCCDCTGVTDCAVIVLVVLTVL